MKQKHAVYGENVTRDSKIQRTHQLVRCDIKWVEKLRNLESNFPLAKYLDEKIYRETDKNFQWKLERITENLGEGSR